MDLTNDANNGNLKTEKLVTKSILTAIPMFGTATLGTQASDFNVLLNLQTTAIDKSLDVLREPKNEPTKKE